MGSNMKRGIFDEQTAKALSNWRNNARERKKTRDADMLTAQTMDDVTPRCGTSPVHLLHMSNKRSEDLPSEPVTPMSEIEGREMYPVVARE
jgi:hypothetical protein